MTTSSRYAQIREGVRQRILRRDYRPGDQLPTEAQLMVEFAVSRGTVSRAIRDLEMGGLIVRRRGAGSFVRHDAGIARPSAIHTGNALARIALVDRCPAGDEWANYPVGLLYQALGEICAQHHVDLSLQRIAGAGSPDLRAAMLDAAQAAVARGAQVVLYAAVELPADEVGLNGEVVRLFQERGVGVLLVGRDVVAYPDRSGLPRVTSDNRRAGAILVRHLSDAGYRRVAFVGIPNVSSAVTERLSGFRDGLRLCGLPDEEQLVIACEEPTDAAIARLLRVGRADAIVCKCTHTAARVAQVLGRLNVAVGPQVGLAGFDGSPIAALLPVPLTTVVQPLRPFAAALFNQAVAIHHDPAVAALGQHITVDCTLVPRASTRRA